MSIYPESSWKRFSNPHLDVPSNGSIVISVSSKHIKGFKFENAIETVRTMTVMLILTKKTKHEDIIRKVAANAYNMTLKISLTEITLFTIYWLLLLMLLKYF